MNHNIIDILKVNLLGILSLIYTSMADVEIFLKAGVLSLSIVYTCLKIYNEYADAKNKNR
jgi:hypothetical protein